MRYYGRVIGHIGPFEIVGTSDPRDCVGLRDRGGRWVVHPDMGFNSFTDYDDGLIIAHQANTKDGYGWSLVDYHGNCISDRFNYIKQAGEGYYMVEKGSKCNVMRRDGSLVLKEWPHRVSEVRGGYFYIGNTIRKTKTAPTKYVEGVAHVSGIIVFPMIFDSAQFSSDTDSSDIYVRKDGLPYWIHEGALFDPQKTHYPPEEQANPIGKFFEGIINWILPGLQFFYRDTDAPIDAEKMYPIGKVLRTGFYTSLSVKLQRPAHKTRFLIASAHAALLGAIEDKDMRERALYFSPHAEEWNQAVIHRNAWLKVLDIYKVGDVTQILMIQIPETAARLLGDQESIFKFVNDAAGNGTTLVDIARRSLDDKMRQLVHPRSTDKEFEKLMHQPIGYDEDGNLYPLEPELTFIGKYDDEETKARKANNYSQFIHYLAEDADIVHDYDGFPWRGLVGKVCEGCMYAAGTNGKPFGCGRLFTESFRKSYISGRCDYWKPSLPVESWFERKGSLEREKAEEHKVKTDGSYAVRVVTQYIKDYLDGDIDNLLKADLSTLGTDKDSFSPIRPDFASDDSFVKSVMEIVFGDCWPDLNVESLDKYQYRIGPIINYTRLTGSLLTKGTFLGLKNIGLNEELYDIAEEIHIQSTRIGNFMVWPNKAMMSNLFDDYKMRGYIDRMFIAMYDVMTDRPKQNMDVKAALYLNRKLMKDYQGRDGFVAFMEKSLLEDFLNEDGSPKFLFDGESIGAKNFKCELLPGALRQYRDFMVPFVQERTKRIVEILKQKLG